MGAAFDQEEDEARSMKPAGTMRFHTRSLDEADGIIGVWRNLAAVAMEHNAFFRPGFALAAARHLAPRSVAIATVTGESDQLCALAPVVETRLGRVAPALGVWVHDYGPLGSPLVDARHAPAAMGSMLAGIDARRCLILPSIPLDEELARLVAQAAAADGRPVARFATGARAVTRRGDGDVAAALPRRRRKEFRRQLRRLEERGELKRVAATEPEALRTQFARFLALEAAGWKGRAGSALASTTVAAQFAREAVFARESRGRVRIDSLELDGRPIAMVVSFVEPGVLLTWKIAYDERFSAYSPGAQLMLELPGAVFADQTVELIDSCAIPDHPMIDRLWTGRRTIGTLMVGPRGGRARFAAAVASARLEAGARALAKRLLRSSKPAA